MIQVQHSDPNLFFKLEKGVLTVVVTFRLC